MFSCVNFSAKSNKLDYIEISLPWIYFPGTQWSVKVWASVSNIWGQQISSTKRHWQKPLPFYRSLYSTFSVLISFVAFMSSSSCLNLWITSFKRVKETSSKSCDKIWQFSQMTIVERDRKNQQSWACCDRMWQFREFPNVVRKPTKIHGFPTLSQARTKYSLRKSSTHSKHFHLFLSVKAKSEWMWPQLFEYILD